MKSLATRLALALCVCPMAVFPPAAHADGITQAQPSTRDLYLTLIRQAREDGHSRAAIAFLDDFDQTYPGDTDAVILRVNCLLDLDQPETAQQVLTKLPARKLSGSVRAARGHVFAALGDWDGAITEYGAALQTIPSDRLANNALGYAQMRSGRLDAAVETLKRARELAPQDPVIRNNLLLALTMAGRKQEADALLTRSAGDAIQAELGREVADEAIRLGGLTAGKESQP